MTDRRLYQRMWRLKNKARVSLYQKRWRSRNPEKAAASCRAWAKKNKELIRDKKRLWEKKNAHKGRIYRMKHRYGVDAKNINIDDMLRAQGGRCAGCNIRLSKRTANLDHCHKSKKIRGLLCRPCNVSLGFIKDNSQTLRRLAHYVEDF